jgi:tetratricopeptide (TPR) repeat protein
VSNLALVLQHQGEYEQAEEMNRRALAGREKALGVDHPSTLSSVYCLAHLHSAIHDYHKALDLYDHAVIGYNNVLGPEHPSTIACQRHRTLLIQTIE